MTIGLTDDQYRRLCLRAFENLPSDTQVTLNDIDAILTWCLPEYDDMKQAAEARRGGSCTRIGRRRTRPKAHLPLPGLEAPERPWTPDEAVCDDCRFDHGGVWPCAAHLAVRAAGPRR
jgi:hypothetical protein